MTLDDPTRAWLQQLHQAHATDLLRWAVRHTGRDLAECQHLLQQAWEQLMGEALKGRRPDHPAAWMKQTMRNKHVDLWRKDKRLAHLPEIDEDHADPAEPAGYPEEAWASAEQVLQHAQLRACVRDALARFAEASRTNRERALALRLVVLEDLPLDEVAALLQRTPGGAMRVFMHGCRKAVQAYLAPCWLLMRSA